LNKSSRYSRKQNDYLIIYNEMLSLAGRDHHDKDSFLASPTMNKEETITLLYEKISDHINSGKDTIKKMSIAKLFLRFLIHIFYTFMKLTIISFRFRIYSIPTECIYIRTYLVNRSIATCEVIDDYFNQLITDLRLHQRVVVGFHPIHYNNNLNAFNKFNKNIDNIIPIGLLRVSDIYSLLIKYIKNGRLQLNKQCYYKGKNITALINDSLNVDYYKLRSFQYFLDLQIAKKIKKYNPSVFLYVFENQAWENGHLKVFKGSKTKLIGYQSSGFTYKFLNFFPSKYDRNNMLFPDCILTVGDYFTKFMKEEDHYPVPIKTFAALRFSYKSINGLYIVKKPIVKIHNRILYAFSSLKYQYKIIITDLIEVFGDTSIEVHLKFHPLYKVAYEYDLPSNFKLWNHNGDELRKEYDIVLFNDNSFGLESIMEGVKSFEYEIDKTYSETRLPYFDVYNTKMNKKNLLKMKESILSGSLDKSFSVRIATNYINKCYKVYSNPDPLFFNNAI
jgi:hypothetical protein